ncbi:hypothetical protein FRX31_010594 [Thalictrum thalictroides]|uniref:Uncharacterized protein n=1 Tax=Thalictrum thalictroides TaxID=46969 RepID=A0A7J6WS39_THATH|nr:hypothetical protein FRX31_010594 [Thalictrum thalictroides]
MSCSSEFELQQFRSVVSRRYFRSVVLVPLLGSVSVKVRASWSGSKSGRWTHFITPSHGSRPPISTTGTDNFFAYSVWILFRGLVLYGTGTLHTFYHHISTKIGSHGGNIPPE